MNSFTQEIMHRLLVLASLFILSNAGLVRVPKIYNALISSDENLSPSHAIPVLEPVLRTTALGVAFPPLFVQPTLEELPKKTECNDDAKKELTSEAPEIPKETSTNDYDDDKDKPKKEDEKPIIPQLTYHGSLYPLAVDSYFPYSYTPELIFPALPYYHQPIFVDLGHFNANSNNVNNNNENNKNVNKKEEQPAIPSISNLKKNPEIPDVPPPPLPIKGKTQRAA